MDVKDFLLGKGFRLYREKNNKLNGVDRSFQKRIDTEYDVKLCHCNDKTFMNATQYTYNILNGGPKVNHIRFLIHGEKLDGDWVEVSQYVDAKDLEDKYDKTVKLLIDMYNVAD